MSEDLAGEVAKFRWYQTLELPGGVVTPGHFDTRAERDRVPLPARMEGKRCLDIGSAEGFWAFEMERRGASEVIAVDVDDATLLDWPGNPAEDVMREWSPSIRDRERVFELVRHTLGSRVQWRRLSIYEISTEALGRFDFAFIGSMLIHLRDPVGALAGVRKVVTGELLSVDAVSAPLTALHPRQPVARLEARGWPLWWMMNLEGYRRLFPAAGFEVLRAGWPFLLKPGPGYSPSPRAEGLLYRLLQYPVSRRVGLIHSWVLARPGS